MTLAILREAVKTNLASVPGVQKSAYILVNATPPVLEVMPGDPATNYDLTMRRGSDQWNLIVRARVGNISDIGAQKLLDQLLAPAGPMSVKTAIESDKTLGGKADDVRVSSVTGYRPYGIPGGNADHLGAEWDVTILVKKGAS